MRSIRRSESGGESGAVYAVVRAGVSEIGEVYAVV